MTDQMFTPPAAGKRARYTYTLSSSYAKKTGVTTVTLVELTAQEELMATKRANNDAIRLAYEMALQCLVAIDGKELNLVDGSADSTWQSLHPMVRQLVIRAYGKLHNVKQEDTDSFLETETIDVG